MIPTAEHIARLTTRVARLVRDFKGLQQENEKLRSELQQRTAMVDSLREQVQSLEQQLHLMRLSAGESDVQARKELEKKLNQYIREIDRCISLLGQ